MPTHLVYTQICFEKESECERNWRYLVPQKGKNINVLCKKTSELLFSVVVRPLQMTLSIARQLLVLLLHVTAHALQQIIKLTIPLPAQYLLNSVTPIILKYLLYAVDTIYYSYSAIEITCYCTLVLFLKKTTNNNSKTTTGSCYIVLQLQLYNKFRLCSIQLIFRRYQC